MDVNTPGNPFLAAMLLVPHDDTPRLAYADWVEDHGDPARGEFVRAHLAWHRVRAAVFAAEAAARKVTLAGRGLAEVAGLYAARLLAWGSARDLAAEHVPRWLAPLPVRPRGPLCGECGGLGHLFGGDQCGCYTASPRRETVAAVWSRGFLAGLRGPLGAFYHVERAALSPGLVRAAREHPLAYVGVTDREPASVRHKSGKSRRVAWFRADQVRTRGSGEELLPAALMPGGPDRRRDNAPTAFDGHIALSKRLAALAREAAGPAPVFLTADPEDAA